MAALVLDEKHRVLLDKQVRRVAGFKKGDRLVAIPFKGGVVLVSPKYRSFSESMRGIEYVEEKHEASKYLFRRRS